MSFSTFRLGRITRKDTLQSPEIIGIQSEICDWMSFLTATLGRLIVVRRRKETMRTDLEDESWLVEAGAAVIDKKSNSPKSELSAKERLIYCLWVADYGMRNAGDLEAASDLYEPFQKEGAQLASELNLPLTRGAFALAKELLEQQYFHHFSSICTEVRNA
jgi:hypothetical protein